MEPNERKPWAEVSLDRMCKNDAPYEKPTLSISEIYYLNILYVYKMHHLQKQIKPDKLTVSLCLLISMKIIYFLHLMGNAIKQV